MSRRAGPPYANAYWIADDTGARDTAFHIARRVFVQITRDLTTTEVPPTVPLDLDAMARRPFAFAWLGHSAQLLRVAGHWVMLDPFLSATAGPAAGVGPARLTPLPVPLDRLPRIDAVLISHDHYDHLDLDTMRRLARQADGAPRFLVGLGLSAWFQEAVGVGAEEHDWWQTSDVGAARLTFLPAQHNSGRGLLDRNATLWGGWGVTLRDRRFYYAGDTAFVGDLFQSIRDRFGAPDVAALPIGAYTPVEVTRPYHTSPAEAAQAHRLLGARRSVGVHWGTVQLGDEDPFTPVRDLALAVADQRIRSFGVVPIGGVLDIDRAILGQLIAPNQLTPVFAA
jgi:N-acyl-phosphatidylethanolamine-hydrolysing phospholipase D